MPTLDELKEQAQALTDEIDTLSRVEDPTGEEVARMAEAIEEAAQLAADVKTAESEKRAADLEALRSFASKPGHIEKPAEPAPLDPLTVSVRTKRDPFDLTEMRFGGLDRGGVWNPSTVSELRSRAHDAIEQAPEYMTDEQRQAVAVKVDSDASGKIAAHCLSYGSPEYVDGWFRYMKTGEKMRAAMSSTDANGGYLIPFHLDPTIILTNAGTKNPFRAISDVTSITTDAWHGVSSAGVTAEWITEATQVADASPTVSQPTITPFKADAYVQASFEVTQDSNIATQIGRLFADAKDRLESAAFATGNGTTQPKGIVTALQAVTASRVTAQTNAQFGAIDVFALVNDLPARHQDNCSWVAHWSVYNLIRQFASGSSPQASAFWVDLGPGIPSQLLGRPTYISSVMENAPLATATASNDDILVLGDFANYKIVDRIGMEVVYNPLVIGANARPTGEVGWAAFWRVGADTVNADAFRLLRV